MSVGMQVAMAGAIGGTAEALGGGKFANGAVTGAYVMMFNHNRQTRQERRIQRRFQQNAMNDPGLANFSIYEYVNGEVIMTESGNEYILWDNKWLDLPEWQTKEISHNPVWDGGENSVGVVRTQTRETFVIEGYNDFYIRSSYSLGDAFIDLIMGNNPIKGRLAVMMYTEAIMTNRMNAHDNVVNYWRNRSLGN